MKTKKNNRNIAKQNDEALKLKHEIYNKNNVTYYAITTFR